MPPFFRMKLLHDAGLLMDRLPAWTPTGVLFLGILLFGVGFSLRRKSYGILLLGLGVVCMLSLIAWRVFSTLLA